ncbi:glycosyltransferase family 2 protein [Allorhizocola rhizosphaerae]|uniref:glycosyltransferase family 2 protein n=1 Tax=Allorhizocola rhizosphaerae TaxID=1872709 RepID=UPI000E3CAA99|nr:glycosyltransferase family 2 protein [Allorhizocola rhizosphaerae]
MNPTPDQPAPIRVMLVELGGPLPPVDSLGGRYDRALLILLDGGVPVARLNVPCGIGEADLRQRIDELVGNRRSVPAATLPGEPPLISVVVPSVFERADLLLGCVESLLKQDYPRFEIIVVDNRPAEDHARIVERLTSFAPVRVVSEAVRGRSSACNRGLQAARGDIVTFTDDDVEVTPGWLAAIARSFAEDPDVACVTGPLLPRQLETPSQIWFERSDGVAGNAFTRITFRRLPRTFRVATSEGRVLSLYQAGHFGDGPNMSFRTAVLRSLGGFEPALGLGTPSLAGEDPDVLVRLLFAGHTMAFDPRVFILHTHISDYEVLKRTMFGYGCGYTAMLTGLVWSDRRHLLGLTGFALRAAALLVRKFTGKRREAVTAGAYPRELSQLEFRGLLAGPGRYLLSRRTVRRWAAAASQLPQR